MADRRASRWRVWLRRSAAAMSLSTLGLVGVGCEAAGAAGAVMTADKAAGAAAGVAVEVVETSVEVTAMILGATGDLLLDVVTLGNNGEEEPTDELTLEEGRKLVAEMQKNPNRINTLTNRERRFLAKAVAAANDKKDKRRR